MTAVQLLDAARRLAGPAWTLAVVVGADPLTVHTVSVGYDTDLTATQSFVWLVGIYRTGGVQWPETSLYMDEIRYGDKYQDVQPGAPTGITMEQPLVSE